MGLIDLHGRDLSAAVRDMETAVTKEVKLPAGDSLSWSGQFEFLESATAKFMRLTSAPADTHDAATSSYPVGG